MYKRRCRLVTPQKNGVKAPLESRVFGGGGVGLQSQK